ncbi:MAG TPA: hypothetical protein VN285_02735 [Candidatus Deferrimicrobium sp.]|nr:hypothetical protein [Candidatus Deferrimicrobium sp.]
MAAERKTYQQMRPSLKTGDVILFSGKGGVSDWIKLFTSSAWSHIGMVLSLPDMDMVLLMESTTLSNLPDFETGRARKGVQLVPLSERLRLYNGKVAVRKLSKPITEGMAAALGKFRKRASRLPYEKKVGQLIRAAWDGPLGGNKQNLSSVFCSEPVAESYQRMGSLPEPPKGWPSNEFTPRDFSTEARQPLNLLGKYELGDETWIKK